ncbi:MAG: DUF1957 domain-containing protein [Treponema sp.]|jgi:1,4-alpha-glucan branching enzyme|nr:DUF1957 domain-containing protein [Treponema sp.]
MNVLSLVINAHYPFFSIPQKNDPVSPEEEIFFESVSDTYLPLLAMLEGLEARGVSFKIGMVLGYSLCTLLKNSCLMRRYQSWLRARVEFGIREQERTAGAQRDLAAFYLAEDTGRLSALESRYNMDIIFAFEQFRQKGMLELISTSATHAFLPFFAPIPEAIQAQIETGLIYHRKLFGKSSAGFFLPDLGWKESLEKFLCDYRFLYTIVDEKSFVLIRQKTTAPVQTPRKLIVLAANARSCRDLEQIVFSTPQDEPEYNACLHFSGGENRYRRHFLDAGFELSSHVLGGLDSDGVRHATGYRYWHGKNTGVLYQAQEARALAASHAAVFLDRRIAETEKQGVNLCVFNADDLGRRWHEGMIFLENLISGAVDSGAVALCAPGDYAADCGSLAAAVPGSASALDGNYSECLLDASNDWIYRHLFRALQRMISMTERFPADTGLKERALNQAAREVLLAQSSDWAKMLNPACKTRQSAEFARREIESALLNLTAIYEALGSNYISTEWLTELEKKHPLFPQMNYHVFDRKIG